MVSQSEFGRTSGFELSSRPPLSTFLEHVNLPIYIAFFVIEGD